MLQNLFEAELVYLDTTTSSLPIIVTKHRRYNINDLKKIIANAQSKETNVKIKPVFRWVLKDTEDVFFELAKKGNLRLRYIKIVRLGVS